MLTSSTGFEWCQRLHSLLSSTSPWLIIKIKRMKLIKLAVISVVILFLLATGMGLLFPGTVVVSRAVDITANKDSLLPYVQNLYGWQKWIVGMNTANTTLQSAYTGTLGKTQVHITESPANKYVVTSVWNNQEQGWQQNGTLSLIQQDTAQATTVVHWQFVQQLHWYPWERFGSMLNDKILGTMMEQNLHNLKKMVEQLP